MNERFATRIAEAYGRRSEKYASVLEPILSPMANEIVDLARLRGRELVLDLATGTGLIARTVAQFTDSIIGVDISLGVLARVRSLSAAETPLVAADTHGLPFRDQCFDLVTCGLSLSHFSDVSAALGEISRILRSRGGFITSAWGNEGENPSKSAAVEVRRRFLGDREVVFEGTFFGTETSFSFQAAAIVV
jgi:ubiquinone/menaquinone biosynthesis C-methylase UbiE